LYADIQGCNRDESELHHDLWIASTGAVASGQDHDVAHHDGGELVDRATEGHLSPWFARMYGRVSAGGV